MRQIEGQDVLTDATPVDEMIDASIRFFEGYTISKEKLAWLGDGNTSQIIIDILKKELR